MPKSYFNPTLKRRILAVAVLALSFIPTLGIFPLAYYYLAHRKVVNIQEDRQSELNRSLREVFDQTLHDQLDSPQKKTYSDAIKAIQQKDPHRLLSVINGLKMYRAHTVDRGEEGIFLNKRTSTAFVRTVLDHEFTQGYEILVRHCVEAGEFGLMRKRLGYSGY